METLHVSTLKQAKCEAGGTLNQLFQQQTFGKGKSCVAGNDLLLALVFITFSSTLTRKLESCFHFGFPSFNSRTNTTHDNSHTNTTHDNSCTNTTHQSPPPKSKFFLEKLCAMIAKWFFLRGKKAW
jgi:hypothetical protein